MRRVATLAVVHGVHLAQTVLGFPMSNLRVPIQRLQSYVLLSQTFHTKLTALTHDHAVCGNFGCSAWSAPGTNGVVVACSEMGEPMMMTAVQVVSYFQQVFRAHIT